MRIRTVRRTVESETGEILFGSDKETKYYVFNDKGYALYSKSAKANWSMILELDDSMIRTVALLADNLNVDNSIKIDSEKLAEKLSITKRAAQYRIKELRDRRVILKDGRKLFLNPLYVMVAPRLSRELYKRFERDLDHVVPDWVKNKWKEQG